MNKEYREGYQAYWQNKQAGFNSHVAGSSQFANWLQGWFDANDEDLHEVSAKESRW